jgi:alpha-L-fucosidase
MNLHLAGALILFALTPLLGADFVGTSVSVAQHRVPDWFQDAKLGIFIDWGVYSVPAWAPPQQSGAKYPDWYLQFMYDKPEYRDYHRRVWGSTFQRDDFIPLFTAADYRPKELVDVALDAGAKYLIPFAKHHDGFCLWPSSVTDRTAAKMGPKRDLIDPLVTACRAGGLKFGFYQSLEEWEYPLEAADGSPQLRQWKGYAGVSTEKYDPASEVGKITGKRPVRDYVRDYLVPQTEEFIDRYDPDLLWFDGDWGENASYYDSYAMAAYFYNHAGTRKEVAVNDRLGKTRGQAGDFYTSEYGQVNGADFKPEASGRHKWEECRGLGQSFGFNRNDTATDVLTSQQLIRMLVEIVAKDGNLLLVINLDGKGGLSVLQKDRLHELGQWLKTNGEAIYGTRPWRTPSSAPDLWFTQSKDGRYLYAISFDASAKSVTIPALAGATHSSVQLLGSTTALPSSRIGDTLQIALPASVVETLGQRPWVAKISLTAP